MRLITEPSLQTKLVNEKGMLLSLMTDPLVAPKHWDGIGSLQRLPRNAHTQPENVSEAMLLPRGKPYFFAQLFLGRE